MHLQLLAQLKNSSFVKMLLRDFVSRTSEKAHGYRYTLVVCRLMLVRLCSRVPAWHTEDCNKSPV